jgi:hypothetical protein
MRSEREHLASRLDEIARPGSAGDRERIVAYALRYGSETLTDDEAFAEARDRLGENGTAPSEIDPLPGPDEEREPVRIVTVKDFAEVDEPGANPSLNVSRGQSRCHAVATEAR